MPGMSDARRVDGLDVKPGQLLRTRGVVFKVTAAARKKVGGQIVNTVQVERLDTGGRGYIDLPQGSTFTVGRQGGALAAGDPAPAAARDYTGEPWDKIPKGSRHVTRDGERFVLQLENGATVLAPWKGDR